MAGRAWCRAPTGNGEGGVRGELGVPTFFRPHLQQTSQTNETPRADSAEDR